MSLPTLTTRAGSAAMSTPVREKDPTERYYDVVAALRIANERISQLETSFTALNNIVLELTTAQNQWSSQAAEHARRLREKVKENAGLE